MDNVAEEVLEESLKLSSTDTVDAEDTAQSATDSPVEEDKAVGGDAVHQRDKEKINIRLNPVGNAPILKQKLWAVPADREVGQIVEFVKKYLKLDKQQSLFLFVNQSFAPSPDQPLRELYECFGSDGKIIFHYSTTYAWG